jgi:PAS domain S-box-containing protein
MSVNGKAIHVGFGLVLAMLGGLALLSYRSTTHLIENTDAVVHTHEVLEQLDILVSALFEAESAARAYVVAGAEAELKPFWAAVESVHRATADLRQLAAANPNQQLRLATLERQVEEKLALHRQEIELRRSQGAAAASALMLTGRGRQLTAPVQSSVFEISEQEKSRLARRTQRVQSSGQWSTFALAFGALFSIIALLAVYHHLNRQIARRRQSEASLIRMNRLYTVLSNVKQSAAHIREPGKLLAEAGRIAVEDGGFELAWCGLADPASQSLRCAAHRGANPELAAHLVLPLDRGPGAALRLGRRLLATHFGADSALAPWSKAALDRGCRSGAAFPILVRNDFRGALAVFSSDPEVSDETGLALLDEVAADLAFALETTEREERRRLAEDAVRRQAQIIDQVHDSIVSTDLEGRVTSWNKGAERLFGYSAEEAQGRHISFVYTTEDREILEREIIAPLKTKGTHEIEVRMRKKSGAQFHAHLSLSMLRDASGAPQGMIGYSADITEAVLARAALGESEERFRQMAESIQEVFWLTDPAASRVLYISPAYEQTWGRSCASLYSASPAAMLDAIHPEDRARGQAILRSILEGREFSEEFRILRPDGSLRWIWDRGFPIRDDSGCVRRFAGIAQDITGRKQAELALQARMAQQRTVAELGRLAVETKSLEALFDETVRRIAEVLDVECAKILELQPGGGSLLLRAGVGWQEGAVGHAMVDAGPASQAGFTLLASHPVVVSDLRTETRFSGPPLLIDHHIVSGVSVIIGDRERPFGVLGAHSSRPRTFSDEAVQFLDALANMLAAAIDRTRAEQQITRLNEDLERRVRERTAELAVVNQELALRNREVERVNRLKTQFLASMSHELRTPLNAIIGFSDLLAEQSAGPINNAQRDYLEHVQAGAQHLLELVNDVLDLSKIEAGRIELHPEDVPVTAALQEVLSTIAPLAMARHIQIQNLVSPEIVARADTMRLRQVLLNLLSNALKFTPERGRVWIESSIESGAVCISVGDSGIGIAPEDQEAVFEEFHRIGPPARGVKEGAGLGLSITRRLVERHGGRIWVESQPGQGSLFRFTLPTGSSAGLSFHA